MEHARSARVPPAYRPDGRWRNRDEFFSGREAVAAFRSRKWARELDYRLIKELWAFTENRIAVRFVYESHDAEGRWRRKHGNENWLFDADGYMAERHAGVNEVRIAGSERLFRRPPGRRPNDRPGLTQMGL